MKKRIIDLSLSLYNGAPTMQMDPKFNMTEHSSLKNLGYNLSRITISTHQGTHIDVPRHFFNDGLTIEKLDLSRCIVKAFIIDLTDKNPKEPITPQDLRPFEKNITKGASIILQTGWWREFPKQTYFTDFPYVTTELTDWLIEKQIDLLGMDMPTPNPNEWKSVHESLLSHSVVIIEGLANLSNIKQKEFELIVLPLKLVGADGSPVRAVAIEEGEDERIK